ncbi:hypothetical protein Agub_g7824 [Astrephomene gubernaculifera]|uniref:PUB domain-containing protein n=1 Tax=Astrephomene gubernaculifera TaxID=47775 RepID=A0AAD3DQP3_9CHLO|nr:hypothetical protein Agub_g7824 [Astrephomene gubernaculifera]
MTDHLQKPVGSGAGDHSAAVSAAIAHEQQKQVQEGRRKFYSHLEDHVLDYLHNNPIHIEACLNTCIKLFGNVVHNPQEEKYRKVKAANAALRNALAPVKGGEDLPLHAGWTHRVVEMEKYWVFDAEAGSVRFRVLQEALHLCEKALQTVHEKAEKKRLEREEKLQRDTAEKERVRLAIEADKEERRMREEMAAAARTAAAAAAAAAAAPASPTTSSASRKPPGGGTPKGTPSGGGAGHRVGKP